MSLTISLISSCSEVIQTFLLREEIADISDGFPKGFIASRTPKPIKIIAIGITTGDRKNAGSEHILNRVWCALDLADR